MVSRRIVAMGIGRNTPDTSAGTAADCGLHQLHILFGCGYRLHPCDHAQARPAMVCLYL